MADDKRNREQEQGGNPGADGQRGGRDRKPGGIESPPGSGRARREDQEDQPQE